MPTTYTKSALDKRLHITTDSDLVAPSAGANYITVHDTVTGTSGRQVHVVRFKDDTLNKEFMCTFMCPVSTSPDYAIVYYDGVHEIRAYQSAANYTRLELWDVSAGTQVTFNVSTLECNSYTAHT